MVFIAAGGESNTSVPDSQAQYLDLRRALRALRNPGQDLFSTALPLCEETLKIFSTSR